jgi:anaerobic ribonucleoside-triphosphate reductase activating protein
VKRNEENTMKINLAHLATATDVLGPGRRAIVWVQGCPRRCYNCITPQMQAFIDKEWVESAALAERIFAFGELKGLTFVGGEPFSQAQGLSELIACVQAQAELSVFTYTGHTFEQIKRRNDAWWNRLVELSDILVDGEYVEQLACDLLWRGSSNQQLYFLSERYRHLEPLRNHRGRYLELDVTQEGDIVMIGIPSPEFMRDFKEKLQQQKISLHELAE